MNVSQIAYASSLYGTDAVSSLVASATNKQSERLSRSVESTKVQLSAYGQVKSATAQVETAAKTLQDNKQLATLDDVKKAVQGLASAINTQRTAVNQVAGAADSRNETAGALSGDARVRSAATDVRRTLQGNAGSNEQALRQIGINLAQDGRVTVDSKKLEQAYQSNSKQVTDTLSRIGKDLADVADKQLSAGGNVGASISRLNDRLGSLQQSQSDFQSRLQAAQQGIDQRNQRSEQIRTQTQQAFGLTGANAYLGVFSF